MYVPFEYTVSCISLDRTPPSLHPNVQNHMWLLSNVWVNLALKA